MQDLAAIPWVQGSLVTIALSTIFTVAWLIYRGRLVPRSTLDDVRADRDARVKEAAEDAEEWRRLWLDERTAHETTRQAYAEELRATLLASTEGAQIAAALLAEIKNRQIEAKS